MKKTLLATLLVISGFLAACTTMEHRKWVAVGGSKADGVVILGFDIPPKIGIRETEVEHDAEQANSEADKRCKNWGYAGAEAFREDFPIQIVCHSQGISPCWSKTYRITYQCLDKKP